MPHLEQRTRSPEFIQRYLPADEVRERLGLDLTARAAITDNSHKELPEAVVELAYRTQCVRASPPPFSSDAYRNFESCEMATGPPAVGAKGDPETAVSVPQVESTPNA